MSEWYGEGAVPPNEHPFRQVAVAVGGTAPSLYQARKELSSLGKRAIAQIRNLNNNPKRSLPPGKLPLSNILYSLIISN